MEIFKSKVDFWLLVVIVITVLVSLGAAYLTMRQESWMSYIVALFITTFGAGLPVWLLVSTKYIVSEDSLRIKSGPFSWSIPISSISSVAETRNLLSSPALSLDRLVISYGAGETVMVSPANKENFRVAIG